MENLKIVNKYSILTDIQIVEECLLLKFTDSQYFDTGEDIYFVKIFGQNLSEKAELLKVDHLNAPTVIVEEFGELAVYRGNLDESPDWGDWTNSLSLDFESYEGKFIDKTQEDWDNELIYLLGDKVRTKAFQSTVDSDFRKLATRQIQSFIDNSQIRNDIKENLSALLNRIDGLDDESYYGLLLNEENILNKNFYLDLSNKNK